LKEPVRRTYCGRAGVGTPQPVPQLPRPYCTGLDLYWSAAVLSTLPSIQTIQALSQCKSTGTV